MRGRFAGVKAGILALVAVHSGPSHLAAQTFLQGELPPTLDASGNPFIAIAGVTVADTSSCVIGPGVELNFANESALGVSGNLEILGTELSPVVFQPWSGPGGPHFLGVSASGSASLQARWLVIDGAYDGGLSVSGTGTSALLEHVTIDGVSAGDGLRLGGGSFEVRSVTVSSAGFFYAGFSILPEVASITMEDCHVSDCEVGFRTLLGQPGVDTVLLDCSATNCTTGFELKDGAEALGVTATGCTSTGILLESTLGEPMSLTSSSATGCAVGVWISGLSSPFSSITNVTMTGNDIGVRVDSPAVFRRCTFDENANYSVRVGTPIVTFLEIDMDSCYWGPVTTAEMIAEGTFSDIEAIYDFWDASSASLVSYDGFASGPVSVEPTVVSRSWARVKAAYR